MGLDEQLRLQPRLLTARYLLLGIGWLLLSDSLFELLPLSADGRVLLLACKGVLLVGMSALVIYWLQRRAVQRLLDGALHSERVVAGYARMLRGLPIPCFVVRPDTLRIEDANSAAMAAYAHRGEALRHRLLSDFSVDQSNDELLRAITNAPSGSLVRHRLANGQIIEVEIYASALATPIGELQLVVCADVSAQVHAQELLRLRAAADPLTGLATRTTCHEHLMQAICRTQGRAMVALMSIDVDHFRLINDSRGHAYGDRYLRDIAARLSQFNDAQIMVARYGGDRFMVVVSAVERVDGMVQLAGLIQRALVNEGDGDIPAPIGTCSIGLALYPLHAQDGEALISAADAALYKAKQLGRGRLELFDSSIRQDTSRYVSLVQRLRQGLDQGEFWLRYQPQFALQTDRIAGIEVLLAWSPNSGEAVGADVFIAAAERSGLIIELGQWITQQALQQFAHWRDAGLYDGSIALNVSPVQLHDAQFADRLLATCRSLNLAPALIELEITETVALDLDEPLLLQLHTLARWGFRLALDDFGRGYSSLTHLKRLPISTLKLDISFVRQVHRQADSQAIVRSMLSLAKSLRLNTVAEGVEQVDERDWLRQHGCDAVQGYFYSRPLPALALTEWLQRPPALPI